MDTPLSSLEGSSVEQDCENSVNLKEWRTPNLKVLPVPAKTQSGGSTIFYNDQEDTFYTLLS